MTISATTQGLRPGVCTSTSRPSTPFAGQLIFETDTNRLAVWNGTSWVFLADADTPSGLQLITNASFSASSGETYTCFSSEFDNYKVSLAITATSATDVGIGIQYGNSGTFSNTTYGNFSYYVAQNNTSAIWHAQNLNATYATIAHGGGDKPPYTSNFEIMSPFLSERTTHSFSAFASYLAASTQWRVWFSGSGTHDQTTSYSQLRIFPVSGTMTGRIKIYGYRNS